MWRCGLVPVSPHQMLSIYQISRKQKLAIIISICFWVPFNLQQPGMRTTMLVKLLMFGTHGDTAFHDIIKENYRCSNTPNFHWSYRGTWDNQTGSWNLCAICQWLLPRALPANRSRGRARFMSNQWPLSPQPVLCRVRRRKSTTRQNEGPDSIWILYGIPGCDYFYIIISTVKERRSKDYFSRIENRKLSVAILILSTVWWQRER